MLSETSHFVNAKLDLMIVVSLILCILFSVPRLIGMNPEH